MPARPHKLELYRWAVQHPLAEVGFLSRAFAHYNQGDWPTLLREDFAGTGAVAAAWALLSEDHRALAVERHAPTLRWAQRRARRVLGGRAEDLIFVQGDVEAVRPPQAPRVDVVTALNFSVFEYHTRESLRSYFRAARRSLRTGGVLVIDAYGGPGAMRVGEQRRAVKVSPHDAISDAEPLLIGDNAGASGSAGNAASGWQYVWDQRSYDAVTGKVDCRIHFRRRGRKHGADTTAGDVINAFRYDWRLWTLPELVETMGEAGFAGVEVWCDGAQGDVEARKEGDRLRAAAKQREGAYRPMQSMAPREDWVAYVVGRP